MNVHDQVRDPSKIIGTSQPGDKLLLRGDMAAEMHVTASRLRSALKAEVTGQPGTGQHAGSVQDHMLEAAPLLASQALFA